MRTLSFSERFLSHGRNISLNTFHCDCSKCPCRTFCPSPFFSSPPRTCISKSVQVSFHFLRDKRVQLALSVMTSLHALNNAVTTIVMEGRNIHLTSSLILSRSATERATFAQRRRNAQNSCFRLSAFNANCLYRPWNNRPASAIPGPGK